MFDIKFLNPLIYPKYPSGGWVFFYSLVNYFYISFNEGNNILFTENDTKRLKLKECVGLSWNIEEKEKLRKKDAPITRQVGKTKEFFHRAGFVVRTLISFSHDTKLWTEVSRPCGKKFLSHGRNFWPAWFTIRISTGEIEWDKLSWKIKIALCPSVVDSTKSYCSSDVVTFGRYISHLFRVFYFTS